MLELNKEQIKEILPHREDMLPLEKIIIQDNKDINEFYQFKADERFFKRHFPGNPFVPGVILYETMAQASCGFFIEAIKRKYLF